MCAKRGCQRKENENTLMLATGCQRESGTLQGIAVAPVRDSTQDYSPAKRNAETRFMKITLSRLKTAYQSTHTGQ